MLRFYWLNTEEAFNSLIHQPMDVLKVVLKEDEGMPAVLDVTVPITQIPEGKCGLLTYTTALVTQELFRGFLLSTSQGNANTLILSFSVQKTLDKKILFKEAAVLLKEQLMHPSFYHPLFGEKTPQDLLSTQPVVFYWDRKTGHPRLCDAIPVKEAYCVTAHYDRRSLKYEVHQPVTKISLELNAQWIQSVHGIFSDDNAWKKFFPLHQSQDEVFPRHTLCTYTPKTLQKNWPKMGSMIGSSGYSVGFSRFSKKEEEILVLKDPDNEKKSVRAVKKIWFDSALDFCWRLKQKREETLTAEIKSAVQRTDGITKSLFFRLNSLSSKEDIPLWNPRRLYEIGDKMQYGPHVYIFTAQIPAGGQFDPSAWAELPEESRKLRTSLESSFFLTAFGQEAFHHALKRAKTALIWGGRCFHIHLEGPLQHLASLTTEDLVRLEDPRLPGGKAVGKVISYQLSAQPGQESVSLTLACSIGDLSYQPHFLEEKPLYIADGYLDPSYVVRHNRKEEGPLSYYRYDDQKPQDPYHDALVWSFQRKSLLKQVKVKNSPDVQEKAIKEAYKAGKTDSEQNTLKNRGTQISFEFFSLRGKESLKHTIQVKMASDFVPKCTIQLNGVEQ